MVAEKLSDSRKPAPLSLRRKRGFQTYKEALIRAICLLCASISIATTFGIVFILAKEAFVFFTKVTPWEFFTGTRWAPLFDPSSFGVLPLLSGTLIITIGAAIFALPLGLLAGLYLSEYASTRVRNILKPSLELLAGIPTVVYGYFGVLFVTPLLKNIFPTIEVFNALSGAIVVGIMILPLVSTLCEDALSAVPRSLREGAYALGSTKFEVSMKVVVPAGLSGVVASFVLAISRAIGETMAVTLAAGMSPKLTLNPLESIQTMTSYIVQVSRGDTPGGTKEYQTIFAVGATLLAITMVMNILAHRLVKRFRQVYN